ncbi:MAG: serine/threonine-protein kinase [Cellvibrio sp.]
MDDDKTRLKSRADDATVVLPKKAAEKTVLKSRVTDQTRVKQHAAEETRVNPRSTTEDETILQPPKPSLTDATRMPPQAEAASGNRVVSEGDIIKDRFVLDKLLGSGGMGAVFRALDLRKKEAQDDRPYIAIKLLGENFKNHPHALITLQREAKKTQDLAHPNIVTVYDFDRDGDLVYLTMEELKGSSLEDLLEQDKYLPSLDVKQKLKIIREIAQGLSYAHSKGIVHSDLKPGNVFITESGTVKLLDFGIARAVSEQLYHDSFDAGELGAITYSYASPEMVRHEPPHFSDDIYALGIIACELLGGEHPFDRIHAQNAMQQQLTPKLPRLKNPLLTKLLAKSIAFQRDDRVADADTFLRKLNNATRAPKRIAVAVSAICLAALGNYFYIQSIEIEAIPFSDLSPEMQADFHAFINEGKVALSFGDLQGAVFNIDRAYQIHATNDDVKSMTKEVLTIMERNLHSAETDDARDFYKKQLNELRQYPAFAGSDIAQ